jgi:DNA-binding LacI/PurR family transcriptional regulator
VVDVARKAAVSTATVSRALRFPEQVSPQLLSRVAAAVSALAYSPNASARALATQRSGVVAIVVGDLERYARIVTAAVERLAAFGLASRLSLAGTASDALDDDELEGAIFVAPGDDSGVERARLRKVHCVAFGPEAAAGVRVDLPTAANRLALHLAELGDREIALLGGPATDPIGQRWRAALRDRLPLAAVVDRMHSIQSLIDRSAGRAIVCASDQEAASVLAAASRAGAGVPAQVACVGFGDESFAADLVPSLTTLRLDHVAIGRTLAAGLLGLRAGGAPIVERVVPKLVIRRSTGFT